MADFRSWMRSGRAELPSEPSLTAISKSSIISVIAADPKNPTTTQPLLTLIWHDRIRGIRSWADMTKVYTAGPGDGFEWVNLRHHDDRENLLELGEERVADGFQPLPAYRILEDEGETFEEADMPWMGGHFLVMRDHVREALAPIIADDVEFLPLTTDDGLWLWMTHSLRLVPVLDLERSEIKRFHSSGRIMRIVRHHFLPEVKEAGTAFHLAEMKRGRLYVTERVVDAIQQAGFTGPKFTEIWDAEKC